MNFATLIPPKVRKAIYLILALAVPALTILAPEWAAVVASLAAALGFTVAHSNVTVPTTPPEEG